MHILAPAGNRTKRYRGQSVVELALLLPILIMLLLGALDLGRAFHYFIAVSNATRAGGVYAIDATALPCSPPSSVDLTDEDAVKAYCDANHTSDRINLIKDSIKYEIEKQNITVSSIKVTPDDVIASQTPVTVTVAFEFKLINPLAQVWWGDENGKIIFTYESIVRYA